MSPTSADLIASLGVPAIAGLAGVLVGAWLTARRDRAARQSKYIESQLEQFYSPMLGLRNEIRTHGRLRTEIQDTASSTWQELCIVARASGQEHLTALSRQREQAFSKIIDYDNQKLEGALLPAYDKMIEVFRTNFWLADSETQTFYPALVRFVEIWRRWKAEALPPEVLNKLGHTEDSLRAFYEHIERKHETLRAKLRAGEP
jgi:uncharacterized membrane-anchored protein YhcB (DUF1043 family)